MAAERLGTGWLQFDVRCLAFNDLMENVIIMDLMAIRIATINIGGPFSIAEYPRHGKSGQPFTNGIHISGNGILA